LSVGVRGVIGVCTYFAFSNFDKRQESKLRMLMQIMAPHYHLAYLRGTSQIADSESHINQSFSLTPREEEIMRWVAEGKTNWEISGIVPLRTNTVKTHLQTTYKHQ